MDSRMNSRHLSIILTCCLVLLLNPIAPAYTAPGDEFWSDEFCLPGLSSIARTFTVLDGDIIVGGDFEYVEQMRVDHIARYDGENWWPLGDGFDNIVMDAIVFENELIVCGYFDTSGGMTLNHVARWSGTAWELMGIGLPGACEELIIYNGTLYCENYRWNGSYWIEAFTVEGGIRDMTVYDGHLVVAGNILFADGMEVDHIFTWNGSQVDSTYQGELEPINDLETLDSQLFMTTRHTILTPSRINTWSDGQWQPVGDLAIDNDLNRYAMIPYLDELVLLTKNSDGDGISPALELSRWDGTSWHLLDQFPGNSPLTLHPYENGLLIGGNVCLHGSHVSPHMLYWEPGVDHHLFNGGHGLAGGTGRVTSLVSSTEGLAVGGRFQTAGRIVSMGAALWNGSTWEDWGLQDTGFSYPTASFWAADQYCSVVYPVNDFNHNFLLWRQDNAWHTGTECLAVETVFNWNGLMLAAGADIYHTPDPQTFVQFADVMGGTVDCLGVWNTMLIAGGDFSWIDGVWTDAIALYNGIDWQEVGGGIDGTVLAVTQHDGRLIAGGGFHLAGTTPVENIAAWDGQTWQPLGAGFDTTVRTLAVCNGHLFAGGSFTMSGGTEVNHIARWDGLQWQPLGSGIDEYITEMTVHENRLFVGGSFTRAGGKLAYSISSWSNPAITGVEPEESPSLPHASFTLHAAAPNPFNPVTTLRYTLDCSSRIRLDIYDLAGRLVRRLFEGPQAAGTHQLQWRGTDQAGQQLPAGAYLVRLSAGDQTQSRKVTLLY